MGVQVHSSACALSRARWFWYSWQRADPFASATTNGKRKPRTRQVVGYGHAAERVLNVMTEYATTGDCWLSVPTIATLADCSERMVQMSLRDLCADGLLVDTGRRSGSKYRNTRVYRFGQISPNVEIDKNISFVDIESVPKTSGEPLPHGHGEAHAAKPTAKANPLSPTGFGPSPDCAAPLPTPQKEAWPTALTCPERQQALIAEALLRERDSRLVMAWKQAHADAGLPVPAITAIAGAQLRQITRGKNALDYIEFRDRIIPCVVPRWEPFLGFWLHEKKSKTRKAPLPTVPSIGFLKRHRKVARKFAEWMRWVEAQSNIDLPPDVKEHMLSSLHGAETGPLPANIPAPYNKGKVWNSPVWAGHPKEKPLIYEAKGSWSETTEATAIAKLVKKGVAKDHAIAVLKYTKGHWVDWQMKVKCNVQAKPHPHLVASFWKTAETFYEEHLQGVEHGMTAQLNALCAIKHAGQ